jgi:hypothetical protein
MRVKICCNSKLIKSCVTALAIVYYLFYFCFLLLPSSCSNPQHYPLLSNYIMCYTHHYLQDFRYSQWFLWGFQSAGMSCFLTGSLVFNILKYHSTFLFKGKQSKQNFITTKIYIFVYIIWLKYYYLWYTFCGLTECKKKTLYHVPEDLNFFLLFVTYVPHVYMKLPHVYINLSHVYITLSHAYISTSHFLHIPFSCLHM